MSKYNNQQNSHISEPFLARALRYCIYMAAFMPLIIFSQYISPFHFGKVVIFRSLVEIMAVGYLMLIWKHPAYRLRTNKVFWTFLAFTAAFSVTTLFSIDPYNSFWGSLERMGGLWTFWHYLVFYIILVSVLKTRQHWYRFIELTIFTSILSSIYGFGQRTNIAFFIGSGGRERIFGTIGNAALFAGYEIVNFFMALTFFLRPDVSSTKKWWLFGVAIALDGIAIIMTVVRGSLLGLAAGLLIFSFLYYVYYKSKRAKTVFLTMASLAIIGVFVILTPVKNVSFIKNSRFFSRITDTSFDTLTAKTRFWAWEAGFKGWKESPKKILLGWGPENFNIPFSKYFNPQFFRGPGSETLFDRAHNMFVEVLVTMGLLGFLAYLSVFYAAFASLWKLIKKRSSDMLFAIGFIPLIVAYMIHNSFIFDTSANFLVFFSLLGFITFLTYQDEPAPAEGKPWPLGFRTPVGIAAIIASVVIIWKTNLAQAKANYTTTRAIVAGWQNDFDSTLSYYKQALSSNTPGVYDYRHRYAQWILEYAAPKKIDDKLAAALMFGIQEVQKNIRPGIPDYLPDLYISRLYITLGKDTEGSPYNDEALKYSMAALQVSPTFVRTYYEIAQAYLNKRDWPNAIKYFSQAAQLNPTVGLSYWYWGVTEYDHGDKAKAYTLVNKALELGTALGESDYVHLVNIYIASNDLNRVIQSLEALTGIAPTNVQYWSSLASAYSQARRIDDAVAAARKAAELDPTFEPQAKAFVESLGRTW